MSFEFKRQYSHNLLQLVIHMYLIKNMQSIYTTLGN